MSAGATMTAKSLLGQFQHGERICNNQQRGRRPEQGQEQRPPQDGQKGGGTAGLDSS
jgi:hypothetical protein